MKPKGSSKKRPVYIVMMGAHRGVLSCTRSVHLTIKASVQPQEPGSTAPHTGVSEGQGGKCSGGLRLTGALGKKKIGGPPHLILNMNVWTPAGRGSLSSPDASTAKSRAGLHAPWGRLGGPGWAGVAHACLSSLPPFPPPHHGWSGAVSSRARMNVGCPLWA